MSVPSNSTRSSITSPTQDAGATSFVHDASVTATTTDGPASKPLWKHGSKRFWLLLVLIAVVAVVGIAMAASKASGKIGTSSNNLDTLDEEQPNVSEEYRERFTTFRTTVLHYSDPTAFTSPSSPQSRALNWMVFKDSTVTDDNADGRLLQRYALMVFFYACGGQDWDGFLSPLDEQQDRSECLFQGVTCNENGRITALEWFSLRVAGQVPDEIGLLSHLSKLDLSDNLLEGTIPKVIFSKLTSLKQLYLDINEFTSTIASDVGNLSHLEELALGHNYLTGSLPIIMRKLASIRDIILTDNDFTGPITDFLASWKHLEDFRIDQTLLSSSLPANIGDLTNLTTFSLTESKVSGTIPETFAKLTKLTELRVLSTSFSGSIPGFFGSLTNLEILDFRCSSGNGTIPSSIGLLTNLKTLFIEYNTALIGTIPTELGNLVKLEDLHLSGNRITGSVPTELSRATNLKSFELVDSGGMDGSIDHMCFVPTMYFDCDLSCSCCPARCEGAPTDPRAHGSA